MPTRLSPQEQARFSWQLAHLLHRTSRLFGMAAAVVTAVCLSLPGAVGGGSLVAILMLLLAFAIAIFTLTAGPSPLWIVASFSLGLCILLAIGALPDTGNIATVTATVNFAAIGIGALAPILVNTRGQLLVLALLLGVTLVFSAGIIAAISGSDAVSPVGPALLLVLLGWGITVTFGLWLRLSLPRVMRRVGSIGRAYNMERRASETETQRHQNARLLHDTALSTLTLLAHSGVGVSDDALRAQAASDRLLLARLRLGDNPKPRSSGEYTLTNTAELALGGTLDSLRRRFTGMGLDIEWHGSGQLGLPGAKLEAFILALTECLENVRRHSGVREAHVTLSDDGTLVRGVVTDAGAGFDPDTIPQGHLGFAESVVARIRDIGGTVRTFSAPGSGTTVVLEVPK